MVSEDVMELKSTKVTVVGLARSGVAAARLLQAAGAAVTLADKKERSELGAVLTQIDASQMLLTVGSGYETALESAELVVISIVGGIVPRLETVGCFEKPPRRKQRGTAKPGHSDGCKLPEEGASDKAIEKVVGGGAVGDIRRDRSMHHPRHQAREAGASLELPGNGFKIEIGERDSVTLQERLREDTNPGVLAAGERLEDIGTAQLEDSGMGKIGMDDAEALTGVARRQLVVPHEFPEGVAKCRRQSASRAGLEKLEVDHGSGSRAWHEHILDVGDVRGKACCSVVAAV